MLEYYQSKDDRIKIEHVEERFKWQKDFKRCRKILETTDEEIAQKRAQRKRWALKASSDQDKKKAKTECEDQ